MSRRSSNQPQRANRSATSAPDSAAHPARRAFLGNALKIGAGSLLLGAPLRSRAADGAAAAAGSSLPLAPLLELPGRVFIAAEGTAFVAAARQGSRFDLNGTTVKMAATPAGQEVRVSCPGGPLARVVLRWETTFPGDTLFLGDHWERTRRMGINTLACRLPQNGTFFATDAGCAAHTNRTPWEFDWQYLDLIARSGAPLFISVDPRTIQPEQKAAFRAAMQTALSGGDPGGCEPLDWLNTTAPRVWRLGNEKATYHWEEPAGASTLKI